MVTKFLQNTWVGIHARRVEVAPHALKHAPMGASDHLWVKLIDTTFFSSGTHRALSICRFLGETIGFDTISDSFLERMVIVADVDRFQLL